MSVFGGDSWGREAQYRKRRVSDLLLDGISNQNSYKKLSSGKYACLLCPHSPVLDTPLLLSMHMKGSRHRATELKVKERELAREDEIKKRVALSSSAQGSKFVQKPLIQQSKEVDVSEIIQNTTDKPSTTCETQVPKFSKDENIHADPKEVEQQQVGYRAWRERELKFTAAGWKRDCYGGWFRDENVEFDSDEEDPNVSLPK